MSQIPHQNGAQLQFSPVIARQSNAETYQTNLNHPQHSKSSWKRLTLVMLCFLRVPLTVRTALTAFLLTLFLASSAGAVRTNAVRDTARAGAAGSTAHRAHRSTHPSSHTAQASDRRPRTTKSRQPSSKPPSRAVARHTARSSGTSGHRAYSSTKNSAGLRRTRRTRSRSRAHFVPVASAPAARPSRAESRYDSSDFATPAPRSPIAESTSRARSTHAPIAPTAAESDADTAADSSPSIAGLWQSARGISSQRPLACL